MYPEIYDELIKSEVADIKNVGDGRWGGAITAAKFLEQFVGKRPGPTSTSPARPFATSPNPGATAAPAANSCARWWKWPATGSEHSDSLTISPGSCL